MRAIARLAVYCGLVKTRNAYRLLASIVLGIIAALPLSATEVRAALLATLGGVLVAAGANCLNMFIDRDADALDERTARRPIPSGEVGSLEALVLAASLIAAGTMALEILVGTKAAGLALAAVAVYALVYPALKPRSPVLSLVGGVVWASPILILCIAIGRPLSAASFSAFTTAALWTALHVWCSRLSESQALAEVLPIRRNIAAIALAIALVMIVSRRWDMLPLTAALIVAALTSFVAGKARTDRIVSSAAIIFIAGYTALTAIVRGS